MGFPWNVQSTSHNIEKPSPPTSIFKTVARLQILRPSIIGTREGVVRQKRSSKFRPLNTYSSKLQIGMTVTGFVGTTSYGNDSELDGWHEIVKSKLRSRTFGILSMSEAEIPKVALPANYPNRKNHLNPFPFFSLPQNASTPTPPGCKPHLSTPPSQHRHRPLRKPGYRSR